MHYHGSRCYGDDEELCCWGKRRISISDYQSTNSIEHKLLSEDLKRDQIFLPPGPVTVGITSGASTPDRAVEAVIEKLMRLSEN